MRVTAVVLLLALAACSAPKPAAPSGAAGSPGVAAQPWERDAFTKTSLIEIDGNPTGYLVEYQATPAGVDVERALPVGSYRIQGRDFEDIGFISPRGEVRRYLGTASVSLGAWGLDDGLLTFFGGGQRVRLTALEATSARPRAAAAAADEAATDAPTDSGDREENAEGEESGASGG